MKHTINAWATLALFIAVNGCRDSGTGLEQKKEEPPSEVRITDASAQPLRSGATRQLQVVLTTRSGAQVAPQGPVAWTSSDPEVASVSEHGIVTARRVGTATITARVGGVDSPGHPVTVRHGTPTTLVIRTQPAGAAAGIRFATQPVVEVRDDAGNLATEVVADMTVAVSRGSDPRALQGQERAPIVNGVATFTEIRLLGRVGEWELIFSAPIPAVAAVRSAPLHLGPGAPRALQRTSFGPLEIRPTEPVRPTVGIQVIDLVGNRVDTSTALITALFMRGVTSVRAVAGVAEFSTLVSPGSIGSLGSMTFTSPGLMGVSFSTGVSVPASAMAFQSITAGGAHTCGGTDARLFCWGSNSNGQLGDGTMVTRLTPREVVTLRYVGGASAGGAHTCATSFCWGANASGQLGDRTTQDRATPVFVSTQPQATGAAGGAHTCTYRVCWGSNASGQLGDGTAVAARTAPEGQVGNFGGMVVSGDAHSCIGTSFITDVRHDAHCWGEGTSGQLGNGGFASRNRPVPVENGQLFYSLSAGGKHTCAIRAYLDLFCWGDNGSGQLGEGSTTARAVPVRVVAAADSLFAEVAAGGRHTCALARSGITYCWGDNTFGQLGTGGTASSSVPVPVLGNHIFIAIDAGARHTCAIATGGRAYCWGDNATGQLGDGTTTSRSIPTPVAPIP